MSFRQRFTACVMLLTLVVVPSLSLCAGWQSSADARMACCAGSHEEQSQATVDTCCAAGEHRQNADSFTTLFTSALLPTNNIVSSILSVLPDLQGFDTPQHDLVVCTTDRYLLLSVFLI